MNEDMALNQEAEEVNSPDTTPVAEQEAPEEATPEVQEGETTPEVTNDEAETGRESKKGASNRVRELLGEVKSLRQRLDEVTDGTGNQTVSPQFPTLEPGTELSPDQYRQHVMQTADSLVSLRLKQAEAVSRIKSEAQEAVHTYPELDPDNESFNKELSDSVTEAVEAMVKANPYSASVKKFVDKLMKPYQAAVTKEVGQARETIAKQVSQAALRPTSVSKPQEKTADEMSIAELEAKLGVIQA